MDIFDKLFGSSGKVKLLRLFLLNPNQLLDRADIIKKARISSSTATTELGLLSRIGMLKKKSFFKETKSGKKKRVKGFMLNPHFPHNTALRNLLVVSAQDESNVVKRISRHGKIKLIITSGIFMQEESSRLDLLVVGDNLKEGPLKTSIGALESEIGKTIKYAIFTTQDFKYRLGICDRLVRDVFDYPHQVVVDKLGV